MARRRVRPPAHSASGFKAALFITLVMGALCVLGLGGCVIETVVPATPAAQLTGVGPSPTSSPMAVGGVESSPGPAVSGDLATPAQSPPTTSAAATGAADQPFETPAAIATQVQPGQPDLTASPGTGQGSPTPTSSVTQATATTSVPAGTSDLLRGPTATGTRQPGTPSPALPPGSPVGTATTQLNVRAGPGTAYPALGYLERGQSVQITGVSPGGGWWQIYFPSAANQRGWVSAGYITAQNTASVPVVQPPAAPTAPISVSGWRGEYFGNRDLAGKPALVRADPQLKFDWQASAPADGLPVDDFSVRWTGDLNFSQGNYRFYAYVDDGVRLWIDGKLVIDQWRDSTPTTYTADAQLSAGKHTLVMEYYEHTGNAIAQLEWEQVQGYPDWRGEYFANPGLNGAPVLVRNDTSIDFYWDGSPGPGVPADNFSARWTRTVHFPGYVYRFNLYVDDGARLWVDDQLIIDAWRTGAPDDFSAEIGLSDGPHTLRLEYFEFRYGAQLYLNWEPVQNGATWEAEYFDNEKLKDDPVLERDDGLISFNWGDGSPGPGVPADNFSARWRRNAQFDEGTYIFSVWVDDGVRLWVDGVLLIDSWQAGRLRMLQASRALNAGTYLVEVEYFERTGHAQIEVSWDLQ